MEQYYDDVKKLYDEKEDADIYELLDFCEKYDGELNPEHIPSLLRLLYGDSTVPEQNETIANMLDTIVERYGQAAVNTIVENSYMGMSKAHGIRYAMESMKGSELAFYWFERWGG